MENKSKSTSRFASYSINVEDDGPYCGVTGMAMTNDKRRLLVDYNNKKVKLFSQNMKFLSSVPLPDRPWDVAAVDDKTAVVTTENDKLVKLDISGRHLKISRTEELDHEVLGIASCKNKLLVTCPDTDPPSVKYIGKFGRAYKTVYTNQQGEQLFLAPWNVCCYDDGGELTAVVTDWVKHTLTLLKAKTGEVVATHELKRNNEPSGVTTDTAGNVYVCYYRTDEVAVFNGDLTEERILLTRQHGLRSSPDAILFDEATRQLIVSYYGGSRIIDVFSYPN